MKALSRRITHLMIVLFVVTFITYILLDLLPGDPAVTLIGQSATPDQIAAARERLNLDQNVILRYFEWLGDVVRGDLGSSFRTNQPVMESLGQRVPVTVELMALAQIIALVVAIPLGVLTAYRPDGLLDRMSKSAGYALIALAPFVLAMLLIYLFASTLGWLPSSGYVRLTEDPIGNLRTLLLPAATLAAGQIAVYHQLLRADMMSTLREDWILMARSKGLPPRRVLWRHALRPSSFSLVTLAGVNVGRLIGGSVVVEVIFAIPGVGQATVNSVTNRDFITLQGMLLFTATAYVVVNLFVDVVYVWLDPRARHAVD